MMGNLLRRARGGVLAIAAAVLMCAGLVAGPAPAASADPRLDFTGTTISGAPFDGASLQGKPVVLWFWTPWCPFCNQEAPTVSRVAAANPDVTFVGVAARSEPAAMQEFASKYNLNFTNLDDADGAIWARFDVPWQPAYLFVKPDGTSTFVNNPTSAISEQDLAARVAALTA
ncbi:protein disulfide oxidoreductase [Mycolicibacterium chitae]|uniref:Soluble secreted antigen MPT53 n=1 Tax=Mycolicibacterium chitae TaxID=1792 RepID=A0A448I665_MYCCI|nr:protein disulfide oxidoreductase [Mycolicibacterium chitae]MCV7109157.1 protein disulfide oxidoreductase [Mycolicibacterium chitae]VEG48019.1 soluble secreted antigen MPT53 [Mycolicibacterium chitae]